MQAFGLKVVEIPRNMERSDISNTFGTEGFDILQLEKLISEKNIKAILCLANFNNPDGLSISDDNNKKAMALLSARLKVPIIEDDIYTDLHF